MIGDARQHVGEPGLGVDVVELGRLNQGQHDSGTFAATIRSGEDTRTWATVAPVGRPPSISPLTMGLSVSGSSDSDGAQAAYGNTADVVRDLSDDLVGVAKAVQK